MNIPEGFRECVGFPGYWINNMGVVRSKRRCGRVVAEKWLQRAPSTNHSGYLQLTLRDASGHMRSKRIHVLVLEAWVGPRPRGAVCRHLDGNQLNNHVDNLRWGTIAENADDQRRHGTRVPPPRGVLSHLARYTEAQVLRVRALYAEGVSGAQIGRDMEMPRSTVHNIVRGHSWKYLHSARKEA